MAEPSSTVTWITAGKVLGGCRIVRELGRGGMGLVFLAEHLALNRPVALKTLLPDRVSRDAIERFLREARLCSRIEHPNVITVHDAGMQDNVNYMVMQYVEGKTLSDYVREVGGPLPWRLALRTMRSAVRGTGAVHQHQFVHRDIKPSNIMVSERGRVFLMDFGLAREEGNSDLTSTRTVLGTPAFMSPEQARGEDLDHRSDIFSLGSTLYFALAGKYPFPGTNIRSVLVQIGGNAEPIPVHQLNPEVPRPVSDFLRKAMSPARTGRFRDAEEMSAAIGELLRAPPSPASSVSAPSAAHNLRASRAEVVSQLAPLELVHDESDRIPPRPWALIVLGSLAGLLGLTLMALVLNAAFSGPAGDEPPTVITTVGPKPRTPARSKPATALPTPTPAKPTVSRERMGLIPAGFVQLGNNEQQLRDHATRLEEPKLADAKLANFLAVAQAESKAQVFVPEFWIDKYEVTIGEYATFLQATHHAHPARWSGPTPPVGKDDLPVTHVTFDDATAYAEWAGKKLPTGAQWDRAFRGDGQSLFPWGDRWDPSRCNVAENRAFPSLSPVNATPLDVSPFGVFNMVGNADEIVRDEVIFHGRPCHFVKGSHFSALGGIFGIGSFRFFIPLDFKGLAGTGFRCVLEPP